MKHKILIVDDDQAIRTMLSKVLTQEGHEVVLAFDGEDGVKMARGKNPT